MFYEVTGQLSIESIGCDQGAESTQHYCTKNGEKSNKREGSREEPRSDRGGGGGVEKAGYRIYSSNHPTLNKRPSYGQKVNKCLDATLRASPPPSNKIS